MSRVLVFIGTRPEAIKLAMLCRVLREKSLDVVVCATGQHTELIAKALEPFDIVPDVELNLERSTSDLAELTSTLFSKISGVVRAVRPTLSIAQGDTTTALVAGMCSFYDKVPVAHVEAGLRTSSLDAPFPEELNRRLISRFASIHFAPTEIARDALLAEGCDRTAVHVVGNTVVDALLFMQGQIKDRRYADRFISSEIRALSSLQNIVLFTCHRRENQGEPMRQIAKALGRLTRDTGAHIVFPVHPNPIIGEIFRAELGKLSNVHFISAQNYPSFVLLTTSARLLITDSGGVQEEAASLGIPFLVAREETERPEALVNPAVQLVGANAAKIFDSARAALLDGELRESLSAKQFPFGRGDSAEIISSSLVARGFISLKRNAPDLADIGVTSQHDRQGIL